MNRFWKFLGDMPSTNVRIAATILMALGTGVRVVGFGWDPPDAWLIFLTGWAGLDVLQFGAKRATASEYVAVKQGMPPAGQSAPPEVGA